MNEDIEKKSVKPTTNKNVTESTIDLVSMADRSASEKGGLNAQNENMNFLKLRWILFTRLEKFLTLLILALAASTIILVILLVKVKNNYAVLNEDISNQEKVCFTPSCVKAANELIQNMDPTVDPCDDFYQYACSGFQKKFRIPDDNFQVTQFTLIRDKVDHQIRDLLEENNTRLETHVIRNVRKFYKSCMNTSRIDSLGVKPLKNILNIFGGWPVLKGDEWDEQAFEWENLNLKFRQKGYNTWTLFKLYPYVDFKNSTFRTITMDQPELGLGRKFLIKGLKNKQVQYYFSYMKKAAIFLGADEKRAHEELLKSLNFEMMLANISTAEEDRRNFSKWYYPMKLNELHNITPGMIRNWTEYVGKIGRLSDVGFDERIVITSPTFFKNLTTLIARESKRNLANYMLWRVVMNTMNYLSQDAQDIQHEYQRNITGNSKILPRWILCIDKSNNRFPLAIGNVYVKTHFDNEAKEETQSMVKNIRTEFRQIIKEVEWVDPETKNKALKKLDLIQEYIGFPSELLNNSKVNEVYKDIEIDEDNYFNNWIKTEIWKIDKEWKKLREKVNKIDWRKHGEAAVVNAFYNVFENSIEFPAGVLQGSFYGNKRPKFMNYAGIGWIIGHEFTHGFDDRGRQFDEKGNLFNWWANKTRDQYVNKSKCIVEQYGGYIVKQVNQTINGVNTQGENIADNGGLKVTYRAYKSWVTRNGHDKLLPGIKLNHMQLFWLSAANTWCWNIRSQILKYYLTISHHSPKEFRVNGVLKNLPEFARDFHCELGSPMNPVHKCSVW